MPIDEILRTAGEIADRGFVGIDGQLTIESFQNFPK